MRMYQGVGGRGTIADRQRQGIAVLVNSVAQWKHVWMGTWNYLLAFRATEELV